MLFCQQTHKTLKYHLVTVKPSFAVKMIDCMHQTGPTGRKLERLGMSPKCCTITMSVMLPVAVSKKWELFFTKPGVKTNRQYCWDILLSQQILDAMKHVINSNFIFQQDAAQTLAAFNTVQLLQCKTPIFLSFSALPQNSPE